MNGKVRRPTVKRTNIKPKVPKRYTHNQKNILNMIKGPTVRRTNIKPKVPKRYTHNKKNILNVIKGPTVRRTNIKPKTRKILKSQNNSNVSFLKGIPIKLISGCEKNYSKLYNNENISYYKILLSEQKSIEEYINTRQIKLKKLISIQMNNYRQRIQKKIMNQNHEQNTLEHYFLNKNINDLSVISDDCNEIFNILNSVNNYNINLFLYLKKEITQKTYLKNIERSKLIPYSIISNGDISTRIYQAISKYNKDTPSSNNEYNHYNYSTYSTYSNYGGSIRNEYDDSTYDEQEIIKIIDNIIEWYFYFKYPSYSKIKNLQPTDIKYINFMEVYRNNEAYFLDFLHFIKIYQFDTDLEEERNEAFNKDLMKYINLLDIKHVERSIINKDLSDNKTLTKSTLLERKKNNYQKSNKLEISHIPIKKGQKRKI